MISLIARPPIILKENYPSFFFDLFKVEVDFTEQAEPQHNGNDHIEFLVSTNPGLPAKPLAKVASGGELSRISPAIQLTPSADKTTPTMIFDEVDPASPKSSARNCGD